MIDFTDIATLAFIAWGDGSVGKYCAPRRQYGSIVKTSQIMAERIEKTKRMSRRGDCRTIAFVVYTYHVTFPGTQAGSGHLFYYKKMKNA